MDCGRAYPVGPLTAFGQRSHRLPPVVATAAQLLHRAAKATSVRLGGQRWGPGLKALVVETSPADDR
eukprot:4376280-Lingulodinium_polyedra.AAC.1